MQTKEEKVLDPFELIHSLNRLLWLSNKQRLTTCRVEIRVLDIGELERSKTSAVYQQTSGRVVG